MADPRTAPTRKLSPVRLPQNICRAVFCVSFLITATVGMTLMPQPSFAKDGGSGGGHGGSGGSGSGSSGGSGHDGDEDSTFAELKKQILDRIELDKSCGITDEKVKEFIEQSWRKDIERWAESVLPVSD